MSGAVRETFAALNGHRLTALRLTVPSSGPWVADCDLESDPEVSGRVRITIGDLELSGTVDQNASGTFGMQGRARVIAGAGGWSSAVEPKAYHNDAGVKARLVAEDAARAVGEMLGDFVPRVERVGRDYVRQVGTAACVLEDVLGGVPWWVDYTGVTHARTRATVELEASAYEVLAFDPRDRVATLAVDDPRLVQVGSILTSRLDQPQTVRSLELRVTPEEMRVVASCGDSATGAAELLRAIIARATDGKLFGAYLYRVVRMAGARVELQAARKLAGLPDLLPVSMWPGIAGVHAELAPGAEVLVQFIGGDRAQPIITHFAGADGAGFAPTQLMIGGKDGAPVARQGDAVEVILLPGYLSGTFMGPSGPTPISGALTFMNGKALGVITAGSAKVRSS